MPLLICYPLIIHFFFSKPRQSTGNQKGYCGHSGPPLPSGRKERAGTQGTGRDTGHDSSPAVGCSILQVSEHPQLRGKSTGAMGAPNFVPHTQRKAKTRAYLKYLSLRTTHPPTFRTWCQTLSAATNTLNELHLPAYRPNMYPPILCSQAFIFGHQPQFS